MSSQIFFTLMTFSEEQKWWNFQLYCFLHISVMDVVTVQSALFDRTTNKHLSFWGPRVHLKSLGASSGVTPCTSLFPTFSTKNKHKCSDTHYLLVNKNDSFVCKLLRKIKSSPLCFIISLWSKFLLLDVTQKCFNCVTFSEGLLAIFMLWFSLAFGWWNSMYFIFSAFPSKPTSKNAMMYMFIVFMSLFSKLTPATQIRKWCVHSVSVPSGFLRPPWRHIVK